MKKIKLTQDILVAGLRGLLIVLAATVPMWLIGRDVLGEAVISLLYLAPIVWSASRWGQVAGFIPPFYTFAIGNLEGWLVLVIFFAIAIVVVGRIQDSLSKAREATFMYELSSALANVRTQDAVAHIVARYIRQLFQASLVNVTFQKSKQAPRIAISEPSEGTGDYDDRRRTGNDTGDEGQGGNSKQKGRPDRVLPLLNAWGLVGEIQIWRSEFANLPAEDSPLLQNFALQVARAFERAYSLEMEKTGNTSAAGTDAQ
jgi:K+-sensing histidine kinase KdpD